MRTLLKLGIAAGWILAGVAASHAQSYPERPVELSVGIGAGSSTDIMGRLIAQKLSQRLGQPVVVENRPGAGGTLAAEHVATAAPDGYTLLWATSSIPIFPHTYNLRYDPAALRGVGGALKGTMVVLVRNDPSEPKSITELIEKAKADPGSITYGTAGEGSNAHLAIAAMASMAGVEFTHVPYKSSAEATVDILAGRINVTADGIASAKPHIESGAVLAIAATAPERSMFMPDVPTIDEAGVPGFSHPVWQGIFAPAGTPDDIVEKLSDEIYAIVSDPSFAKEAEPLGFEPFPIKAADFNAQVISETEAWAKKAEAIGLQKR